MLSKPKGSAVKPSKQGQATVRSIMEAVGDTEISTEDIRRGIPAPKAKDYIGDVRRAGTISVTFGNVNKGLFNTKDARPKKRE